MGGTLLTRPSKLILLDLLITVCPHTLLSWWLSCWGFPFNSTLDSYKHPVSCLTRFFPSNLLHLLIQAGKVSCWFRHFPHNLYHSWHSKVHLTYQSLCGVLEVFHMVHRFRLWYQDIWPSLASNKPWQSLLIDRWLQYSLGRFRKASKNSCVFSDAGQVPWLKGTMGQIRYVSV